MTNGDRIRKMGDSDLTYMISRFFKDNKKCQMCSVGIDAQGRCKDSSADCEVSIFNWLGEQEHGRN